MEQTTIQISKELLAKLKQRKISNKESYEEVIWDLMEDTMELSEETKRGIAQSRKEIAEGKTHKWEDIKRKLNLDVSN